MANRDVSAARKIGARYLAKKKGLDLVKSSRPKKKSGLNSFIVYESHVLTSFPFLPPFHTLAAADTRIRSILGTEGYVSFCILEEYVVEGYRFMPMGPIS